MQPRSTAHPDMRNVRGIVLLTVSLLALVSCSNGLTRSSATEAIRADLATTSADVARVAVLSDSGRNEAIVRATIDGRPMRPSVPPVSRWVDLGGGRIGNGLMAFGP